MRCPYCGYDKPSEQFTDEHVLPRALGGNLQGENPFSLRVCAPCNSACGRWVDGPLIKSWPLHNARAMVAQHFVDPNADPTLPLFYMGRITSWASTDGTECDMWLGPTGDHVYHFHLPYPESDTTAGPAAHLKRDDLDPGVAFLSFTSDVAPWPPIVLRSVQATFKNAALHTLNSAPDGKDPPWPPVSDAHKAKLAFVSSLSNGSFRQVRHAVHINVGDRFIVKAGLGMGALFLRQNYVDSDDAASLRAAMWDRDSQSAKRAALNGFGFLSETGVNGLPLQDWKGCHVVGLFPAGDSLNLVMSLYGKHLAGVKLTEDRRLWVKRVSVDGQLWVIAPGLRRFAGPLSPRQFAEAIHAPPGALSELDGHIQKARILPPCRIPRVDHRDPQI